MKIPKFPKFIFGLILSFFLSSISPVVSALDSRDDIEKKYREFQLLSFCKPMNLVVEDLGDDASRIKLTGESIQATVESRLRSARLYASPHMDTYLYVNINVVGNAYSMSLSFKKLVEDPYSINLFPATTWRIGGTGTGDAAWILSHLSQMMDEFLVEYLKVNEEYCD